MMWMQGTLNNESHKNNGNLIVESECIYKRKSFTTSNTPYFVKFLVTKTNKMHSL